MKAEIVSKLFSIIDEKATGLISLSDIEKQFKAYGISYEETALREMYSRVAISQTSKIGLSEFSNMMTMKIFSPEEKVSILNGFNYFDFSKNGSIDQKYLLEQVNKLPENEREKYSKAIQRFFVALGSREGKFSYSEHLK